MLQTIWGDQPEAVQELLQQSKGLQDLQSQWARSQSAAFAHIQPQPPAGGADAPFPAHDRGAVVQQFRVLLLRVRALWELPSALTLFDALAGKVGQAGQGGQPGGELRWQAGELTEASTLVAVVRLCLKCNGSLSPDEMWQFHQTEMLLLPCPAAAAEITRKEVMILSAMDGRVALPSLPSPEAWARTILERAWCLAASGAGGGPAAAAPEGESQTEEPELPEGTASALAMMDQLQSVARRVRPWVELLVARVAMTRELPPQALGVAACVFGAVVAGTMAVDEVRPLDLADAAWEGLLLVQQALLQEPQAVHHPGGPALLAGHLAQAACCQPEDLRRWAFDVGRALQVAA